ncbi:PilZ domain-containing protein [Pelotomaculum isophthalicicum JI]|uniref:PilZ domain-containing protein n=1 Tax=Pelotomaculum isophthalicicum JI TaxID=947010 RepID=A0A9X4JT19_9FIRM|nr:PilZ domain-containing protein [Pelotomaculum isophthalicicum]MDF9407944.1 PilZ domain-containing protein [Pelotomaculum isophthalicicum JI]
MFSNIKRVSLLLAALFATVVFWGTTPVTPACGSMGYDGYAWKLTQAFGDAMNDMIMQNQQYLWLWLALIILLLGLIVFRYRTMKRVNNQNIWTAGTAAGSSTQRDWMRLSIEQEVLYAREEDDKYKRAKVINMSGGGLLFATREELQKDDELEIILELSYGEELNLKGRVVRVTEDSGGDDKKQFMIGLQFLNIKKGEQDKIVRKILQEQQESVLEERRKSKGECILCGKPLPEGDKGVKLYCPKCSAYDNE